MRRIHSTLLVLTLAAVGVVAEGCAARMPCASALGAGPVPPNACHVDGCTLAADLNFASCCNQHDERYWSGGTPEMRRDVDRELRSCIAAEGHPTLSQIYYLGVRLLGTPLLPTPWRWGFGWPYPRDNGINIDNK